MKPTHIEHIGIAVKSLEEAIPFYENVLGLKCYAVEEVKDQKVKIPKNHNESVHCLMDRTEVF